MRRRVLLLLGLGLVLYGAFASSRPVPAGPLSDPQQAAEAAGAASDGGSDGNCCRSKVKVDFIGESLCPDCQHMVLDVLGPMVDNGVAKLMDLRYVAFGNVRNSSSGGYQCQHGPDECKYNRYINCAQKHHPRLEAWFPYVRCMARHMRQLRSEADGCAKEQGWEPEQISGCAEGEEGAKLEKEAADETWGLQPRHTTVPHILVNGVPIWDDFERLQRYVCAATSGRRPAKCFAKPA